MENTRAKFLIERSSMSDKDKKFLLTHIELAKEIHGSLGAEILILKDTIDYNKALNNQILTLKEKVGKLNDIDDVEDIYDGLNKILDYIDTL